MSFLFSCKAFKRFIEISLYFEYVELDIHIIVFTLLIEEGFLCFFFFFARTDDNNSLKIVDDIKKFSNNCSFLRMNEYFEIFNFFCFQKIIYIKYISLL